MRSFLAMSARGAPAPHLLTAHEPRMLPDFSNGNARSRIRAEDAPDQVHALRTGTDSIGQLVDSHRDVLQESD